MCFVQYVDLSVILAMAFFSQEKRWNCPDVLHCSLLCVMKSNLRKKKNLSSNDRLLLECSAKNFLLISLKTDHAYV